MLSPSILQFLAQYPDAALVTDSSDNVLFANQLFRQLTGFDNREIEDNGLLQAIKVKINYVNIPQTSVYKWECSLLRRDGLTIWLKVSQSRISDGSGKELYIYSITENPSLNQLHGLLEESEARFETLADASPVMIWMTDADNLCFYLNKSWLEFTGKSNEEQLGTGWLRSVHPDDLKVFDNVGGQLRGFEQYNCEYRLLRSDGKYRTILEIGTPRFLPDGTFSGYMGSCLDISDMKTAQKELANYTEELKRSNEELEQFAYVASHDMQEPLRMIGSYVQLIQRGIRLGDHAALDDYIKYVTEGVARIQMLINDLLQFSRLNRKGKPFVPVNLMDVMSIVLNHLTKRIDENGATVHLDEMPTINGDASQLIRLFQNMVDNAIKFKAPDRKPVIRISAKEVGDKWLFSLQDNGIGIEDKFHQRIFVIFQRLHTRDQYEGTGIGLAVCKKIIERHGGEIKVESRYGEGTTFKFTLKKG